MTTLARATSRPAYKDRYAVLVDQNIFLKDRRTASTGRERPPEIPTTRYSPPPRVMENSYLLTGIVLEDVGVRAYVEDGDHSKILRLGVGDAVARGVIGEIQIDAIAYDAAGQRTWISIGQNLSGTTIIPSVPLAGTSTTPSGGTGTSTTPTTGTTGSGSAGAVAGTTPAGDPNDPNLTLEQRMKLRRQQQMNQR